MAELSRYIQCQNWCLLITCTRAQCLCVMLLLDWRGLRLEDVGLKSRDWRTLVRIGA